jgi:transposase InsO family protein
LNISPVIWIICFREHRTERSGARRTASADNILVPLSFPAVNHKKIASRAVLSRRLSNTMDVSFCVSALEEALARFGKPEIFNTDQGSQFTSAGFTGTLAAAGVKLSMDGRGRWMDSVFVERVWRSLKHEDIYLKDYADDGHEAKAGIGAWFTFYNPASSHPSLYTIEEKRFVDHDAVPRGVLRGSGRDGPALSPRCC